MFTDVTERFLKHIPPGHMRDWVWSNVVPIKGAVRDFMGSYLENVVARHEAWQRGEKGGKRADLSGWKLAYTGVNLKGRDLSGAVFTGADLSGMNLQGADLTKAKLDKVDMGGANLSEARLDGADLRGAYLFRADMRNSSLRNANCVGAGFAGANLFGADATGAKGKEIATAYHEATWGTAASRVQAEKELRRLKAT